MHTRLRFRKSRLRGKSVFIFQKLFFFITTDCFARICNLPRNLPALQKFAATLPDYPERPQPKTGIIEGGSDVGTKLIFVAANDGLGRFVQLFDAVDAPVLTLFIQSGDTCSTFLPQGDYTLHTAKGDAWYGPIQTFGTDGDYTKSATPLTVLDELHYHTITLGAEEGNTKMEAA